MSLNETCETCTTDPRDLGEEQDTRICDNKLCKYYGGIVCNKHHICYDQDDNEIGGINENILHNN
jgi:hypothetical protein